MSTTEKKNTYRKDYYNGNKDVFKKAARKYYSNNREVIHAKRRRTYAINKAIELGYTREQAVQFVDSGFETKGRLAQKIKQYFNAAK